VRIGPAVSADAKYRNRAAVVTAQIRDIGLAIFNGLHNGAYSGRVSAFGLTEPTSGPLRVRLTNGLITVLLPGAGSGSIRITSSVTGGFTYRTTVDGMPISGTGVITVLTNGSCRASGTWVVGANPFGATGSGTWSLTFF